MSLRSAQVSSFSAEPRAAAMGLSGLQDGGISGLMLFFLFGCSCEVKNGDIFAQVERYCEFKFNRRLSNFCLANENLFFHYHGVTASGQLWQQETKHNYILGKYVVHDVADPAIVFR